MTHEQTWRETVLKRSRDAHKRMTMNAQEVRLAAIPMRPVTPAEARAAIKAMGLLENKEEKCCTSCATWKPLEAFIPRGTVKGAQRYSCKCRDCTEKIPPETHKPRQQTRHLLERACPRCNIVQPVNKFPKDGFFPDGKQRYYTYCKTCQSARRQEKRNHENREATKAA